MFFSHLLFSPEYTPLDDIVRKQKQQIMYENLSCLMNNRFSLFFRRELLASQNENFQLEKKIHELTISIQNPSLANRLNEIGNGLAAGSSAPATPHVVRKYYEMKYGDKGSTSNLSATGLNPSSAPMYNNPANMDLTSVNPNPLPVRNGRGVPSTPVVPQPNVTMGAQSSSTFNLRNKLPNSIQNTLANTSQTIQSKLPASLQKLPASLTQGSTMNMLASKFQNAFS